jgi:G3E family GTPase
MIPLILVTGFLGSGKTTLLKRIAGLNRARRWVYLVNDFAAVDVDGEWVRTSSDRVVAISGGSIFCACLVTEFVRTLRMIAEDRSFVSEPPEMVVIEASGMASPKVIHRMLKDTRLDSVYRIHRVLAVADPGTFHKLLVTLPNVRAQIEAADTVLISKADLYTEAEVERVREAVLGIQPNVSCKPAIMHELDLDLLENRDPPGVDGEYAACVDPRYHSFVLTGALPGIDVLRRIVREQGAGLYRMKGFTDVEGQVCQVDYSSSGLSIDPWQGDPPQRRLVFVVEGDQGAEMERRIRSACGCAAG